MFDVPVMVDINSCASFAKLVHISVVIAAGTALLSGMLANRFDMFAFTLGSHLVIICVHGTLYLWLKQSLYRI